MKKVFGSLGKALLYFIAYFGFQLIISTVMGVIFAVECINPSGEMDMDKYMQLMSENMSLIIIISDLLALLVYLVVTLIRKKNIIREISLNKMKPVGVVPIVIMGISFNFLIMMLISCLPFSEAMQESYLESSSLITGSVGILGWFSTVLIAPIAEEVVFRGFIYSRLKEGTGIIAAVILTSLLFGLMHGTVIWATYAFVLSLMLIFVSERFHSLWASIILHISFNFVGMAISTWSSIYDSINPIVISIGSAVIFVIGFVWFIMLTKKEKQVLNTSVMAGF